jgi:hypothetical protein
MVFGRKKKHQPEETGTRVDLDDYSSDGEGSVPPPPPGMTSDGKMFRDTESQNAKQPTIMSGFTAGEEGEENGISFLTDYADEDDQDEKQQDLHRRKKMLLIFFFLASLAGLVGLAVMYASQQQPIEKANVSTSQAEITPQDSVSGTGSLAVTGAPVAFAASLAPSPAPVTEAPTPADTEEGTDELTLDATEGVTDAGTDEGTDGSQERSEVLFTFEYDCVDHQIFASSSCTAGLTSATIVMCMKGAIKNVYWSWIEYPVDYAAFAVSDWGWLSDGMTIYRDNMPPGEYKIGLYGNDDNLVTSTTFNVLCSL